MKSNTHAIPSALDDHFGKGGALKAAGDVFPDRQIFVELIRVVFAFGIPLGAPVFVDREAETDWINFLSHDSIEVNCSVWLIQRTLWRLQFLRRPQRKLQFLRRPQQELQFLRQELPLS